VQLNALERGQPRGAAPAVILLHGLFGSAANLGMVARALAPYFTVHSLDLRNHGLSPRADGMSYREMAADVREFMDRQDLARCVVLGHSMGGKVAMQLALDAPGRVSALVIADMAPVAYQHDHDQVLDGLAAVEAAGANDRRTADAILAEHVPEAGVRAFLLKSYKAGEDGRWHWLINRQAIDANYPRLAEANTGEPWPGPALFISGALSGYVRETHREAILALFPGAQFEVIDDAGHWLHAERPQQFNQRVLRFLSGCAGAPPESELQGGAEPEFE
jgi:esterase